MFDVSGPNEEQISRSMQIENVESLDCSTSSQMLYASYTIGWGSELKHWSQLSLSSVADGFHVPNWRSSSSFSCVFISSVFLFAARREK